MSDLAAAHASPVVRTQSVSSASSIDSTQALNSSVNGQSEENPFRGRLNTTLQIPLYDEFTRRETSDRLSQRLQQFDVESPVNYSKLPPVDTGFGAWSYAASAFAMFIVVWGFPESFPIFQTYLSSSEDGRFSNSVILALLSPGINDMLEMPLFALLPTSATFRTPLVITGIAIILISTFLASQATRAWQILVSQAILFGIGGIILNFVHVNLSSEWFDKNKGNAMSFIWLGWRFGTAGFPLACQWLLEAQGYESTMRVLMAPMFTLLVPTILAFRGRFSAASVQSAPVRPRVSWRTALTKPDVPYYLFVTLLFSLVANMPTMFITTYGADIGVPGSHQALALTARSLSAMLVIFIFDQLGERIPCQYQMIGGALSTSLVYMCIWGFVKTRFGLYTYAVLVGFVSGSYDSATISFLTKMTGNDNELFTTMHSIFSFLRGAACLSCGPVGMAILRRSPDVDLSVYAIGKYKYLIVYSSAMSGGSGVLLMLKLMGLTQRFSSR